MRKLAVIGLLFIYTASQIGSVMMYYYRPVIHAISFYRQQRRMRQQGTVIKETTMSVKKYLACLHEEDEILLDGILHDIKKITYNDSIVHLQLLEDKDETDWMNTFASFANTLQKQQGSQKWQLQIWKWLLKVYPCQKEPTFGLLPPVSLITRFAETENAIYSFPLNPPGQPPESKS